MTAHKNLDQPRDLYVAFAFAAADLLVEVSSEGKVAFAVGAAMALTGRPARSLPGIGLTELVQPHDRPRLLRAIKRIDDGLRIRFLVVHLVQPDGKAPVPVSVAGYRHPEHPEKRLLALAHAGALAQGGKARLGSGGLLRREDFESLAETMLAESPSDDDEAYRLTLLELPGLEHIRTEAGVEAAERFVAEVGSYLRSCSVGGESAGQLADDRYGLIHSPDVSGDGIGDAVTEIARSFLPGVPAGVARTATLSLDTEGISTAEAAGALVYAINRFAQEGSDVTIQSLTAGVRAKLSTTVGQLRMVKAVIEQSAFELRFQPIVDLWNNVVHHFECLVRFGGGEQSPYDTVTFAEDVGLAGQLDEAICTRAFAFMRSPEGAHKALRFAVNLSGRSLSHPPTAQRLLTLIATAGDLKGRLLFEVTESAAIDNLAAVNAVLQRIRTWGFPVCLDDFGAGAAAFHYLRALTVDHVKIDGSYVKDAIGSGASMPFLRAITQLCSDLGVGTIAEFVENGETAALLKVLKVRYGQGYYFGKPHRPEMTTADTRSAWLTPTLGWRNGLLNFQPPKANPQ
jgi:EAL domain-containing protein (putative c-di-GMP-specific phosphodiesterase class I)